MQKYDFCKFANRLEDTGAKINKERKKRGERKNVKCSFRKERGREREGERRRGGETKEARRGGKMINAILGEEKRAKREGVGHALMFMFKSLL